MKPPLELKDVENKTWAEIYRYYKPEATFDEIDYFLWNETCYPFDDETTVKQINNHFSKQFLEGEQPVKEEV